MIHTIDLNFQGVPQAIAAYLVQGERGLALIETGPASTLPQLTAGLAQHGLTPADIKDVLVTHIHFDHAGAAGWWAQQGATVYVHEVGAPHLIDPSRLVRSATRIYGDDMDRLWGTLYPAPEDKVVALNDGDVVTVGDLQFVAHDTPGHAYHHFVYQLGDVGFTGDAAGICLPGSELVDLPAPPPEFNLEVWQNTVAKIEGLGLNTLYLTHFGKRDDVQGQLNELRERLTAVTTFIHNLQQQGLTRDEIVDAFLTWSRERAEAAGMTAEQYDQYETANPLPMSVDGVLRYWRKRDEQASK
ncbi:MAG TPA: MBL fold metallo-hydrolase [Anaerolineae bacterium]|nr:MBL fold metallo-hydrolase [Anaerolineae bacterium]